MLSVLQNAVLYSCLSSPPLNLPHISAQPVPSIVILLPSTPWFAPASSNGSFAPGFNPFDAESCPGCRHVATRRPRGNTVRRGGAGRKSQLEITHIGVARNRVGERRCLGGRRAIHHPPPDSCIPSCPTSRPTPLLSRVQPHPSRPRPIPFHHQTIPSALACSSPTLFISPPAHPLLLLCSSLPTSGSLLFISSPANVFPSPGYFLQIVPPSSSSPLLPVPSPPGTPAHLHSIHHFHLLPLASSPPIPPSLLRLPLSALSFQPQALSSCPSRILPLPPTLNSVVPSPSTPPILCLSPPATPSHPPSSGSLI